MTGLLRGLFGLISILCWGCSDEIPSGEGDGMDSSGGMSNDSAGGSNGSGGDEAAAGGSVTGDPTSAWPEGKVAAVTLSYDDGLDGQLANAVPALDARGLKATFFLASFQGVDHNWSLPDTTSELTARHEAWKVVASSGHELGGHTIYHPCADNNPGFQPQDYDQARMADELDESIERLARLGATEPLTFAYPCYGDTTGIEGGQSYVSLVDERFLAARTSAEGVSLPSVALGQVAQKFGDAEGTSAEMLIAYVDEAIAAGGWAVFTFHGIGPENTSCDINQFDLASCALNYLTTSNEAHEALLDYLVEKQSEVWTAPMKEVAQHLNASQ